MFTQHLSKAKHEIADNYESPVYAHATNIASDVFRDVLWTRGDWARVVCPPNTTARAKLMAERRLNMQRNTDLYLNIFESACEAVNAIYEDFKG